MYEACKLNEDDPIAAWKTQAAEGARLIKWLGAKSDVHFTGPGTDLRLSVAGRKWINADGTKNFPDGEIFTGPVEDSVNGTVSFSYPAVTAGREIEGIVLEFEAAKSSGPRQNAVRNILRRCSETDEGARRLGEFAIGTNFASSASARTSSSTRRSAAPCIWPSARHPRSGNHNQSAVHWDMICDLRDGGELRVDGELLLKGGKFVV